MESIDLKVGGLTALTTNDFPGRLAAVVFVRGCPWRCGYCHNPHLQRRRADSASLHWDQVQTFLQRRRGLLDGVVFSGGEPLSDPALAQAMRAVRALGFAVGLHTAGIYPRRLSQVLPMLDWVGLDIKAAFSDYAAVTGIANSAASARESLRLVQGAGVDYEVRTTVHSALLAGDSLLRLADELASHGVERYALQEFRSTGCAAPALSATHVRPTAAVLEELSRRFAAFSFRPARS